MASELPGPRVHSSALLHDQTTHCHRCDSRVRDVSSATLASVRMSTAGVPSGVDEHLIRRLPNGLILNFGAGQGVATDRVINVDHTAPAKAVRPFVVADGLCLPFRSSTFSGALLKDVIEHLAEPIVALREVARVVRKDGMVIVEVPRAIPRAVWDDPTHVRGFTSRSITTAIELGGLTADKPRRMGGFPGAGRFRLISWLPQLMRIPVFGHWYGTNWLVFAHRE